MRLTISKEPLLLLLAFVSLCCGCGNPLSPQSEVGTQFLPGLDAGLSSFGQTWNLKSANSSDFTLSSNGLAFSTTALSHRLLTTDQDNSAEGFGGGLTLSNVQWNSSFLDLTAAGKAAGTGFLNSRIFSSPVNTNWTNLTWSSRFPAGKANPDSKAIETSFSQYNLDMTSNVLLYHMDEATWTGVAGEVIDSSGSGHHGQALGSLTTTNLGKYSRAGDLNVNSSKYITTPHSALLENTNVLSAEAWVYPTTVDASPRAIISKRDPTVTSNCAYSMFVFTGGNLHVDIGGTGAGFRFNSGYTMLANTWQHVAFTYDGSLASNRLKIYVNGSLVSQATTTATTIPVTTASATLFVGGLVGNTATTFLGRIDEVAIYRRVLAPSELSDRYNRGLYRIKVQARACDLSDCSDQNFVGPAASTTDFFTESLNTSLTKLTSVALSGFTNKKYFQYKAVLETDNVSASPQLESMSIKPDLYDSGYPTVVNNSGAAYRQLTGFSTSSSGTGSIRFQISNGTNWYYWNGASWALASGFSQTNSESEINSAISKFSAQLGAGVFSFKAFFSSGVNSTDSASLQSVILTGSR